MHAMTEVPEPHHLHKMPLAEALFEVRWAIVSSGKPGLARDPGFPFLLGKYHDLVKNDYPVVKNLPAAEVPEEHTPYMVRHQFRASENGWPVTQIGPAS